MANTHKPGKDMEFERPIATVDVALFTVWKRNLCVVLTRRDKEPFMGAPSLPGGYVHVEQDRNTESTARRVILAKAGIDAPFLEQLYTFSGPFRDPRGWSISVSYCGMIPDIGAEGELMLAEVDDLPSLPFDHGEIVNRAVGRLRDKSSYSSLPLFMMPPEFTLGEVQDVYQQILGSTLMLDSRVFRRRMIDQEVIEEIPGKMRRGGAHRPAQLYRVTKQTLTNFGREW